MEFENFYPASQPRQRGIPPRLPSRQKKGTSSQLVLPSLTPARVGCSTQALGLSVESRALLPQKVARDLVKAVAPSEPLDQASDLVPRLWRALSQVSPRLLRDEGVPRSHQRSVSWSAEERRSPSLGPATQAPASRSSPDREPPGSRQSSRGGRGGQGAGQCEAEGEGGGGAATSGAATAGGSAAGAGGAAAAGASGRLRRRTRPPPVPAEEEAGSSGSPRAGGSPARQAPSAEPEPGGATLCGWAAWLAAGRGRPREGGVRLLASAFEGRPPVLFFDYEPRCGAAPRAAGRVLGKEELEALGLAGGLPKMYFTHEKTRDVHEYNATINTLQYNGLVRTTTNTGRWALIWSCHPTPEMLRSFQPLQRVNHFPASWHLGRKDLLCRNVAKMRRQWPKEYNIAPAGFVLPEDFQAWVTAREQSPNAFWIYKPVNSSCGRGIRLFSSSVPTSTDRKLAQKAGIVQRYLDRPLLIDGFKFDLRLYVVVTSYDPLKVYLNSEGLVRLATERYSGSPDSLDHRTMHLTNYSVNKHSEGYAKNLDGRTPSRGSPTRGGRRSTVDAAAAGGGEEAEAGCEDEGYPSDEDAEGPSRLEDNGPGPQASKWSLGQLREYFAAMHLDYELMMQRIKDLLIKTLIAAEPPITSTWHQGANYSSLGVPSAQLGPHQTCFEIYGFDVMVDDKLKPWLLEVNVFPSLSSSSPFDKRVKTMLIADALTLVGFMPFDPDLVDKAQKEETMKRHQGLGTKLGSIARSHTLQSLPSASIRDFGEAEWRLILDAHDEYMRRGLLERIYPRQETLGQYDRFFAAPRYSNLVLARWLEAGGERCFLPDGRDQVPPQIPRQVHFDAC